jgi:hypothetical protein
MRKIDPNRRGYVYRHIRIDTGEVFYVGVGFDSKFKRAYSKQGRNNWWKGIVKKTDYEVEIIMYDLSISEAFKKEIEFIKIHGRKNLGLGTLCNLTDGGEGGLGTILAGKDFEILSPDGEIIKGNNISKFCHKYNLSVSNICSVLKGILHSSNGWQSTNPDFHRKYPTYRILSPTNELYTFNSLADFSKEHDLDQTYLGQVILKKAAHLLGWHLEEMNPKFIKLLDYYLRGVHKHSRATELINPQGEVIYVENITKFCADNGLAFVSMKFVIRGTMHSHRGYKSSNRAFWKRCLVSPDGILIYFSTIANLCVKYKLSQRPTYRLCDGEISSYRDWSIPTEEQLATLPFWVEDF